MSRLQLVWWWPDWQGFGAARWTGPLAQLFWASVNLGWLELRIWQKGRRP